jgi:NADH dehydrogenase
MKRILVLGGTGFVGRALIRKLASEQVSICVPTRQNSNSQFNDTPGVRCVNADINQPQTLEQLVKNSDVVVNLVAILHGHAKDFDRIHVRLVQDLAVLCGEAGVQHLIHVSAMGADPSGPSQYQRSKGRAEGLLKQASVSKDMPITVLRPSVIFGAEDRFINLFAQLQRFAPCVPLACANSRFQPVWVEDVAQALCELVLHGAHGYRVYEACGPEVFSLADLVRHAGRWGKRERLVLPLPRLLGRFQAFLMEYLPGEPLMSRDNIDSMQVDNISSGNTNGLIDLGITPTRLGEVFQVAPS